MSHEIEKPIDCVFSTKGTEWHGLADSVETITDEVMARICPKIISGPMALNMGLKSGELIDIRKAAIAAANRKNNADGKPMSADEWMRQLSNAFQSVLPMPAYKALVADYRDCAPDLLTDECGGLVPLHIPKNSYGEIENGAVYEAAKASLKDVDARITCAGTLKAGKVFFISAELNDGGKFDVVKPSGEKDSFLANLNFITSHDGTLGVKAYDSTVRIVCMNTLRWSLNAAGEIGFNVYHTKNSAPAMANLPALISAILTGRADFKNQMEYFATVALSPIEAQRLFAGYFVTRALQMTVDEKAAYTFATRTKNTIEALQALFVKGTGNDGKTLYDALNAMTEHYTSGDGTGANADKLTKLCKANFGSAADHKTAFVNILTGTSDSRAEIIAMGARACAESGI